LWKIGPSGRSTGRMSTPASRRASSSGAVAASGSTPTTAAVRNPSLAVVSAAYVTPPPRRQPRGSSGATSRHAEPTWTTSTARLTTPLLLRGRRGTRSYTGRPHPKPHGVAVFFYELHEGDNEVYSDVLVVSESEWEPDEFFELVQSIRRRIQDIYVQDTLIEAIAVELERDHGFIYVSDDRLAAAVNVSVEETENFLAELEVDRDDQDDDDDEDDEDEDDEGD